MKITNKILYIPPFISTTWYQVRSLYLKDMHLVIDLENDTIVEVPNLKPENLEKIFAAHADFLENQMEPSQEMVPFQISSNKSPFNPLNAPEIENGALTFGFGTFDSLGSALQHNSSQSNMPELPKEVLSKISAITKIIAPEDIQNLPAAEPHCNCPYCQIARVVNGSIEPVKEQPVQIEEEIKDTDLNFQQWDIKQTGEKLFSVSHRLDDKDRYSVYLGHPIGCTCGKEGCEHILAVLKS